MSSLAEQGLPELSVGSAPFAPNGEVFVLEFWTASRCFWPEQQSFTFFFLVRCNTTSLDDAVSDVLYKHRPGTWRFCGCVGITVVCILFFPRTFAMNIQSECGSGGIYDNKIALFQDHTKWAYT